MRSSSEQVPCKSSADAAAGRADKRPWKRGRHGLQRKKSGWVFVCVKCSLGKIDYRLF